MPDWLTNEIASDLLYGIAVTVVLTLLTTVTSFLCGVGGAVARRSRRPLLARGIALAIEVFRNVPALILIIFFAFAVPNLFPADLRRTLFFANPVVELAETITGLALPYYALAGVIALTLNTGAHLAELVRSGLDSVPQRRIDMARSLGASPARAYLTVTIPDGVRIAFPGIVNRLVHNLKNTALVSFVAVPDLFHAIQAAISETFEASQLLVLAALLYLIIATGFEAGLRRIEVALWRGRPVDRGSGG